MDGEWKNTLKKIFRKIFFLPPLPTLLIAVPSYLFVIYVLSGGAVHQSVAYQNAYFVCFAYHTKNHISFVGGTSYSES